MLQSLLPVAVTQFKIETKVFISSSQANFLQLTDLRCWMINVIDIFWIYTAREDCI